MNPTDGATPFASAQDPRTPIHRLAWLGALGLVLDRRERKRLAGRRSPQRTLRSLDPRVHRPVFIVGAPRSGTTFLGSRIGMVPEISYHFEPRLTKAAAAFIDQGMWSERTAAAVFRVNYSALLLAGLHGGLRFAEKNPENCFIIPFLAQVFPDASFVSIIRDGRDAAVSLAEKPWLAATAAGSGRRGRGGQEWGPVPRFWVEPERRKEFTQVSDLERAIWCWRRFTSAAMEGAAQLPPHRYHEVRYESLVTDPDRAAGPLADFLGLDEAGRRSLQTALRDADSGSVGRFRARVTPADREAMRRQAGTLLEKLGYDDD
jgi:Sulfotransferase domain